MPRPLQVSQNELANFLLVKDCREVPLISRLNDGFSCEHSASNCIVNAFSRKGVQEIRRVSHEKNTTSANRSCIVVETRQAVSKRAFQLIPSNIREVSEEGLKMLLDVNLLPSVQQSPNSDRKPFCFWENPSVSEGDSTKVEMNKRKIVLREFRDQPIRN